MKKPVVIFLCVGTLNSCHSLDHARNNESIIYFNDLCKTIEIYIYARKKLPFTSYLAAMHPKHRKFAITDMRERSVDYFYYTTRAPAIILLTYVPLQKFPFLFSLSFLGVFDAVVGVAPSLNLYRIALKQAGLFRIIILYYYYVLTHSELKMIHE